MSSFKDEVVNRSRSLVNGVEDDINAILARLGNQSEQAKALARQTAGIQAMVALLAAQGEDVALERQALESSWQSLKALVGLQAAAAIRDAMDSALRRSIRMVFDLLV